MRNVGRLYKMYPKLMELHATKCPDLRFGQLVEIINNYINASGKDPFYVEDEEYLQYAEKWFDTYFERKAGY